MEGFLSLQCHLHHALHPIYLGCSDNPLKNKKQKQYLNRAATLNRLKEIDYEQVLQLKSAYKP